MLQGDIFNILYVHFTWDATPVFFKYQSSQFRLSYIQQLVVLYLNTIFYLNFYFNDDAGNRKASALLDLSTTYMALLVTKIREIRSEFQRI